MPRNDVSKSLDKLSQKIYTIVNMKCFFCDYGESKVIDSRATDENASIRRRRECLKCGKRFTTYEAVESNPVFVIKSDGRRQPLDPAKIKNGIIKACEKRPVPMQKIDRLVGEIEKKISNSLLQEIFAKDIGEMIMAGLRELDPVAYVRFASVYRQFRDVTTFVDFIKEEVGRGNE